MHAPVDELLVEMRPVAFGVAYRMLGSVAEAEDVAQEALLRLHRVVAEGKRLDSPKAYITTIATRLAIDELRSARARRERYAGDWLPEPFAVTGAEDPEGQAEMSDSLSLAFLVLLESLSPEQRAALLLHDVFDYGYDEVAGIVGTSIENARQLTARARRYVRERRPRFETSFQKRAELAQRFFAAVREGDVAGLEGMLAEDVVLIGDGGGNAPSLAGPVHGRSRVAKVLTNWARQGARVPGAEVRQVSVNGQPGSLVLDAEGRVINISALDIVDGQIVAVHSIVNPDKLQRFGPTGNLGEFLRRRER